MRIFLLFFPPKNVSYFHYLSDFLPGELGNSGLGLPSKSDPTGMIFFFCPLGVSCKKV